MNQSCNEILKTPIGYLNVITDGLAVTEIQFAVDEQTAQHPSETTGEACRQLTEYFEGERVQFDLSISPKGTFFQRRVWNQLLSIAFGETCSYGEIARQVASPKASRAVGAANGRNPIPIIIPCHRIIGKSGQLTGYAGGLDVKCWLLKHEGSWATSPRGRNTNNANWVS